MDAVQDRVRDSVNALFLGDVEMGKKDDDHNRERQRPGGGGGGGSGGGGPTLRSTAWAWARVHPRRTLKRLTLAFTVGFLVYMFVQNIPTDNPVRDHRRPVYYPQAGRQQAHGLPQDDDPAPAVSKKIAEQAAAAAVAAAPVDIAAPPPEPYNGPPRFVQLGSTLYSISVTRGTAAVNRNVLFAAASVKSIATLLPLACQMGAERRSYVHFVLMGRTDMSWRDLQQINGIDASCSLFFHDARPDHAAMSADARMEHSANVAMSLIAKYMHPQAIIIDGTDTEEDYLRDGLATFARNSQTPLVQLPANAYKQLAWVTKLDSASLSNWNAISVDILIHASAGSSGSLIRLLKSLERADFGGGPVPHITIELPHKIEPWTAKFIESFQWPPQSAGAAPGTRQLSLRHRIPKRGASEDESASRFLESFWPSHPRNSHVLVLSPQTELSREFFHYLKFALLEYRYSNPALLQEWSARLFGISLDLPSRALDGVTKLTLPLALDTADKEAAAAAGKAPSSADADPSSFLWQAPNSNAMLVLGERWAELHRFVAQLLDAQHAQNAKTPTENQKRVSKKYPSWLELALKLCQARGYWTLYPRSSTASVVATVHNELYQLPEEYEEDVLAETQGQPPTGDRDDADEVRLDSKTVLETLPRDGSLPHLLDLPMLLWDGSQATLAEMTTQVVEYRKEFRRTVGGCSEAMPKGLPSNTLFCNDDDDA